MKATYVLGLDIGTANLRAHRASYSGGQLDVPPQPASLLHTIDDALPTVLEPVAGSQEIRRYGKPALDRFLSTGEDDRYIFDFKPSLGQSPEDLASVYRPGTHAFRYSQEEAFSWTERLLGRVLEDLEERVYGEALTEENDWGVVAGVPAAWQQTTRHRLQEILCRRLHNEQVEIVSDTEAALAYHLSAATLPKNLPAMTMLVFHIGSILTQATRVRAAIVKGKIQMLSARTYTERYGGSDFDLAFAGQIARQMGLEEDQGVSPLLIHRGRKLKEEYSMSAEIGFWHLESAVEMPRMGGSFPVSIDKNMFESDSLCGAVIRKFPRLLRRSLLALRLERSEVGGIIVTGGSAAWYFVRETLEKVFPRVPIMIGTEPQRVVAIGLALAPGYLLPTPIQLRRTDPYALLLKAENAGAEKAARERLEWDADDWLARAVLGYALLRLGNVPEGRRELEKVVGAKDEPLTNEEKQGLSLAQAGMGWILRDEKRYADAERAYERALKTDDKNLLAHIGLGFVFQCRQKFPEAEAAYRRALELDSKSLTALRYLGKLYLDRQQFDPAEQTFRQLLKLDAREVYVYYNLGLVCAAMDRHEEAILHYDAALQIDPAFQAAAVSREESRQRLTSP